MSQPGPFRHRHPIISGCFTLVVVGLLLVAGLSFLFGTALRSLSPEFFGPSARKEGVGVVEIRGVISTADEIIAKLSKFRDADHIKAIVLRIDSPGGAVGASQELYQEVKRTNQVKPVVASMGSVAASGGLYAALGAERIVANPGTITGSIGVILKIINLEELLEKIGYSRETIKSGDLKDLGTFDRPMAPGEREILQDMIDGVHGQFVAAIAEGRQLPAERIRAFADGRILSGSQALELKLIDELGNLNDAALVAAQLAGMAPDKVPHLIYPPRRDFSLLSLLVGSRTATRLTPSFNLSPVLAYEWTITP